MLVLPRASCLALNLPVSGGLVYQFLRCKSRVITTKLPARLSNQVIWMIYKESLRELILKWKQFEPSAILPYSKLMLFTIVVLIDW